MIWQAKDTAVIAFCKGRDTSGRKDSERKSQRFSLEEKESTGCQGGTEYLRVNVQHTYDRTRGVKLCSRIKSRKMELIGLTFCGKQDLCLLKSPPKKSIFGRKDIFQPLPSSILLNNTYPRVFSGYLAQSRTQPALTVLPSFYSSLKAPCVI